MNKIKFAIVGCGKIGKRHAEIITQNQHAELAALIDIKDATELNLQSFSVPFFSSLDNFLHSNIEADVVVIATPNGLHAMQSAECLRSNKHIVVEKPLTLTAKDAQSVIVAANSARKKVFVVMQNRYSPPIIWLKQMINHKVLGEIFSVQLDCFWNRDERYYQPVENQAKKHWHGTKELDGGVLFTQFSHFIDTFYWLFGDIRNIHSKMHSYKKLASFDDSGTVSFEFGNNSIGGLNFSTAVWDKNFESSIAIIGEKGAIKISGQYMDKIEYCHIKDYSLPQNVSHIINDKSNYTNHSHVIQNVIDVLQERSEINATADEGLKVIDIIERMYTADKMI